MNVDSGLAADASPSSLQPRCEQFRQFSVAKRLFDVVVATAALAIFAPLGRLRTRFGEAGRARVLREFTLEKMCEETDTLYARCVRAGVVKTKEQIGCAVSTVN